MSTFFGFGLADSMFVGDVVVTRTGISVERARGILAEGAEICLNPSHAETIRVMRTRFGVNVEIPARAPVIRLVPGDRLLLLAVSGLPRLEGRHEYTRAEIDAAVFRFALYEVER